MYKNSLYERSDDFLMKILLVGDSNVGKSSLLLQYVDNSFKPSFITTIGIDFKVKTIEIDSMQIKLQIWDTAGQERFKTVTTAFFRSAMGVLLVYDITNEQSFKDIEKVWLPQIDNNTDNINKILIGNKCDLIDNRVVDSNVAKSLADKLGIEYMETSAKNNINVEQAYITLVKEVKKRLIDNPAYKINTEKHGIDITSTTTTKKNKMKCCNYSITVTKNSNA